MLEINSNIVTFNVGGEAIPFSTATLAKDHLKSLKQERFFDVDPTIFKKYCAPYIRHEKVPTVEEVVRNRFEAQHLVLIAKALGLFELAQRVDKVLNGIVTLRFQCEAGDLQEFDFVEFPSNTKYTCPSRGCNKQFNHRRADLILSHFLSTPHFGKISEVSEIATNFNPNFPTKTLKSGVIECYIEDKVEP